MPIVMLMAMPNATNAPRRVKSPRMSVTAMNVSVMSVMYPKNVQLGTSTLTRNALYAAIVGYWISCCTQYQSPPSDDFGRKSGGGLWDWVQQETQYPTIAATTARRRGSEPRRGATAVSRPRTSRPPSKALL